MAQENREEYPICLLCAFLGACVQLVETCVMIWDTFYKQPLSWRLQVKGSVNTSQGVRWLMAVQPSKSVRHACKLPASVGAAATAPAHVFDTVAQGASSQLL